MLYIERFSVIILAAMVRLQPRHLPLAAQPGDISKCIFLCSQHVAENKDMQVVFSGRCGECKSTWLR